MARKFVTGDQFENRPVLCKVDGAEVASGRSKLLRAQEMSQQDLGAVGLLLQLGAVEDADPARRVPWALTDSSVIASGRAQVLSAIMT